MIACCPAIPNDSGKGSSRIHIVDCKFLTEVILLLILVKLIDITIAGITTKKIARITKTVKGLKGSTIPVGKRKPRSIDKIKDQKRIISPGRQLIGIIVSKEIPVLLWVIHADRILVSSGANKPVKNWLDRSGDYLRLFLNLEPILAATIKKTNAIL